MKNLTEERYKDRTGDRKDKYGKKGKKTCNGLWCTFFPPVAQKTPRARASSLSRLHDYTH
jgi:hypothetical protein